MNSSYVDSARKDLAIFLADPSARLVFPLSPQPHLSIILLTHNKAELTFRCLQSLTIQHDVPFELIVVDNGSTDVTHELLAKLENALVIRSSSNLFFVRGNNVGAAAAHAPYVLFLNNDTEVHSGTLAALLDTIRAYPQCSAVGGKLIFPSGLLQEAGSIIWENGSALGYGRNQAPNHYEFEHLREVDYCSAACLLVDKNLFRQIGGLDTRFEPAYYEDTDLCMALQSLGFRVVYQPLARVTHHEYSSRSAEQAMGLMQEMQEIFYAKWAKALAGKGLPSESSILRARDRRERKTILVVDDRLPTPDAGSGFPRAYEMVQNLAKRYKVTLFPLQDRTPFEPWTSRLRQLGVECVISDEPFVGFARARERFYDVVVCSRPHNLEQTLPYIKENFPNARLMYDAEALFFKREAIKFRVRGQDPDANFEQTYRKELDIFRHACAAVVVSEGERRAVCEELPEIGDKLFVWGHSIKPAPTTTPFEKRKDLLFVGAFLDEDSPNEDAVCYFVKEIFPLIRARIDCKFIVVGKRVPASVQALNCDEIRILGFVEDLRGVYETSRVFVVPHRFAGGIAWKLSEAMSQGLPCVASDLIASQFDFCRGEVLSSASVSGFVDSVVRLYSDQDLWETTRRKALRFVETEHAPEALAAQLERIMDFVEAEC